MAIRTKEEILESLKARFADDSSDEVIGLIEDINDTMDSFTDSENWKEKYEENDRTWRERYKNRFFNPKSENSDDDDFIKEYEEEKEEEFKPRKYEDLFTTEGVK